MTAVLVLTWRELLRKRVTLMCIIMTALFWIAYWFIARAFANEIASFSNPSSIEAIFLQFRNGALTLALGYFFGSFAVAFLAIFSAVSSISGEAESGVIQTVLARPIRRSHYYAGRWLGFTSFGILYALMLFASVLMIAYMHTGLQLSAGAIFSSGLLFIAVVPLLVSLTMLGSCFLSPLGNGIGATLLFALGWLGGMIERVISSEAGLLANKAMEPLQTITGIISLLMPVDGIQKRMLAELFSARDIAGLFDVTTGLGPFSIGAIPSNTFLAYAAFYTALLTLLGILALRKKDF